LQAVTVHRHRTGDVVGRLAAGNAPGQEARARFRLAGDAVDAEGTPVAAAAVPGQQVPARMRADDRMRLDLTTLLPVGAVAVIEAQAHQVAAGRGQDRKSVV